MCCFFPPNLFSKSTYVNNISKSDLLRLAENMKQENFFQKREKEDMAIDYKRIVQVLNLTNINKKKHKYATDEEWNSWAVD